jgi:hypothetical protein
LNGYRAITGLAVGLLSALALAAPVAATPPASLSGSGVVTSAVTTSVRTSDGNTHVETTIRGMIAGSITGTFTIQRSETIHQSGDSNVQDSAVVTGITPCGPGTFATRVEAMIVDGVYAGHGPTIDNSTNTANLSANFDIVAVPGPFFTYTGTYHCG